MIYETCGLGKNMEWPQWASNFIAAYMDWSEVKHSGDIEFSNMGKFIKQKKIPLAEFKEVVTMTYTEEGLKSTETYFVFGWDEIPDKALFISEYERGRGEII